MNRIQSQHIFIVACLFIMIGLLYSRFMISMGMIFFLIAGLWNGDLKQKLTGFLSNKYYLSITGIFIICLISGLWSANIDYFLERLRIKLPLFFLPFAFYAIPKIDKKIMKMISLSFILLMFSSALWSIASFLFDLEHFIEIYKKGQIIPTPIHHIRYSIMMSLAFLFSIHLLIQKSETIIKYEKQILSFITAFLFIYLHLLAVRSGLLTLYVIVLSSIIYFLMKKGTKKIGLSILSVLILSSVLSIQYVPTIKNKIGYMKYSLELFSKNDNIRELSDSRRLGSIYAGIHLIKENPVGGVGLGDIMDETNAYLELNYPELINLELLPHNQYIHSAATMGIFGSILFILFTIIPLFYLRNSDRFFLITSQLVFFASFLVEHTLESQIGVAIYIFILLFAMKNQESYYQNTDK